MNVALLKAALDRAVKSAVANTLRTVADWGTLSAIDDDGKFVCVNVTRAELREVADRIENEDATEWMCCPLCEEVACDEGCPLEEVRRESS